MEYVEFYPECYREDAELPQTILNDTKQVYNQEFNKLLTEKSNERIY